MFLLFLFSWISLHGVSVHTHVLYASLDYFDWCSKGGTSFEQKGKWTIVLFDVEYTLCYVMNYSINYSDQLWLGGIVVSTISIHAEGCGSISNDAMEHYQKPVSLVHLKSISVNKHVGAFGMTSPCATVFGKHSQIASSCYQYNSVLGWGGRLYLIQTDKQLKFDELHAFSFSTRYIYIKCVHHILHLLFYSHSKCAKITLTVLDITMQCCSIYLYVLVAQLLQIFTFNFFPIKQGIAVSFGVFSASCNLLEMLTVWIFSKIVFFSVMALLISLALMKLFLSTMVPNYSSSAVRGPMKLSCSPVWEKYSSVKHKIRQDEMTLTHTVCPLPLLPFPLFCLTVLLLCGLTPLPLLLSDCWSHPSSCPSIVRQCRVLQLQYIIAIWWFLRCTCELFSKTCWSLGHHILFH